MEIHPGTGRSHAGRYAAEGWRERVLCQSLAAGLVGCLLVGLLLWVEDLDATRRTPDVAAGRPVRVELVRVELPSLPLTAVLRDGDFRPFCFVLERREGRSRVRRRPVVLGDVRRDRVAIAGGLHDGDWVVVRGQHRLRSGDAVEVTPR